MFIEILEIHSKLNAEIRAFEPMDQCIWFEISFEPWPLYNTLWIFHIINTEREREVKMRRVWVHVDAYKGIQIEASLSLSSLSCPASLSAFFLSLPRCENFAFIFSRRKERELGDQCLVASTTRYFRDCLRCASSGITIFSCLFLSKKNADTENFFIEKQSDF
jgi:hypothetical protein